MTLDDQALARTLLEADSFRGLYARIYHKKRQDLLDDLLIASSNNVLIDEHHRNRSISEICGLVQQLREFPLDLFAVAAYEDGQPNPVALWNKTLNAPQERDIEVWNKPLSQQRTHPRLLKALDAWMAFWTRVTSMTLPNQPEQKPK